MTAGPCAARTAAEDAETVEDGLATSVETNMVARTLSAHVGPLDQPLSDNRTLEPTHAVGSWVGRLSHAHPSKTVALRR